MSGFISGDGSFYLHVNNLKSKLSEKIYFKVVLNFKLCLHIRDEEVIKGLFNYLNLNQDQFSSNIPIPRFGEKVKEVWDADMLNKFNRIPHTPMHSVPNPFDEENSEQINYAYEALRERNKQMYNQQADLWVRTEGAARMKVATGGQAVSTHPLSTPPVPSEPSSSSVTLEALKASEESKTLRPANIVTQSINETRESVGKMLSQSNASDTPAGGQGGGSDNNEAILSPISSRGSSTPQGKTPIESATPTNSGSTSPVTSYHTQTGSSTPATWLPQTTVTSGTTTPNEPPLPFFQSDTIPSPTEALKSGNHRADKPPLNTINTSVACEAAPGLPQVPKLADNQQSVIVAEQTSKPSSSGGSRSVAGPQPEDKERKSINDAYFMKILTIVMANIYQSNSDLYDEVMAGPQPNDNDS